MSLSQDEAGAIVEHRWADCPMCGRMVVCGLCGNGACNGTYGEIGGVQCPACPSAYDLQASGETVSLRDQVAAEFASHQQ